MRDNNKSCKEAAQKFFEECVSESEVDGVFTEAVKELKRFLDKIPYWEELPRAFCIGMTARLVLSALMDADRRDTAEFMENAKRDAQDVCWDKALEYEEEKLCQLRKRAQVKTQTDDRASAQVNMQTDDRASAQVNMQTDDRANMQGENAQEKVLGNRIDKIKKLNALRDDISDKCYKAAENEGGIYRMNAPTGSGKTLAVLRYALRHAQIHNKTRIFYIAPLLTIIDQNAKVMKDAVGDGVEVLEHTSDVLKDNMSEKESSRYDILAESWNAPVVITTLVQFLNTLFDDKTTCVRRMNALANSVIILDDLQSLPFKITNMTNTALNFLASCCGATIVCCSATQPEGAPVHLKTKGALVEIPETGERRNRVSQHFEKYGYDIDKLSDMVANSLDDCDSVLLVCNTKSTAAEVFKNLKERLKDTNVYHLSAAMCKKHRDDTLEKVNANLRKQKTVCISTQVIEAGVDISFQRVIRVCAGMDSIVQAAGRCNRGWEYDGVCDVWIVNVNNENTTYLPEIKWAQDATRKLLSFVQDNEDLLQAKYMKKYYEGFYSDSRVSGVLNFPCKMRDYNKKTLYSLLSRNVCGAPNGMTRNVLVNQAFKSAGQQFSVFDANTTAAIVPYDKTAKEIIESLCSERAAHDFAFVKELLRRAKPYIVSLYDYQVKKLEDAGCIKSNDRYNILQTEGYDKDLGVITEHESIF